MSGGWRRRRWGVKALAVVCVMLLTAPHPVFCVLHAAVAGQGALSPLPSPDDRATHILSPGLWSAPHPGCEPSSSVMRATMPDRMALVSAHALVRGPASQTTFGTVSPRRADRAFVPTVAARAPGPVPSLAARLSVLQVFLL
jgi:hypothetical protein